MGVLSDVEENYIDICEENIFNCEDFLEQEEAQEIFDSCGGLDNDIHGLDRDGNGLACEGLS